jgi:hypothetical protein
MTLHGAPPASYGDGVETAVHPHPESTECSIYSPGPPRGSRRAGGPLRRRRGGRGLPSRRATPMGTTHRGYKARGRAAVHGLLIEELTRAEPWLDLGPAENSAAQATTLRRSDRRPRRRARQDSQTRPSPTRDGPHRRMHRPAHLRTPRPGSAGSSVDAAKLADSGPHRRARHPLEVER